MDKTITNESRGKIGKNFQQYCINAHTYSHTHTQVHTHTFFNTISHLTSKQIFASLARQPLLPKEGERVW